MKKMQNYFLLLTIGVLTIPAGAQNPVPPYDLWTPQVLERIRDRSTLELTVTARDGYYDVFYTSNPSANWFEDQSPYAEHRNEKIRIHAFLTVPTLISGSSPALVLGHGHEGQADRQLAQMVASLGYVCLALDGPRAGQSTGGPRDQSQSWISVDKGPEYSFLYHWAYAGMRALTVLEQLAATTGNPYRINRDQYGILGASMGGLLTTYVNGIDSRVKAAVAIVSAGSWHHQMRIANSWLYNGIFTETRDIPYNGLDPINSIENIDSDPTAITFMNYFDPIRYAGRQHGPLLIVIGTHDEYFPMPSANLTLLASGSAGTHPLFEKRLWLMPNTIHGFDTSTSLFSVAISMKQWLDYCFGVRSKPLTTPHVKLLTDGNGIRLEVRVEEPAVRLQGAKMEVHVGVRIDNTVTPIQDFKAYNTVREGDLFIARIPAGETSSTGITLRSDNLLYFATVTDFSNLPISSLLYRAGHVLDLSDNSVMVNRHIPDNNVAVPLPPPINDADGQIATSLIEATVTGYQGFALTNPSSEYMAVRVEARGSEGRLTAQEGLINPIFVPLPPGTQRVFVAEEWFGPGVRRWEGGFYLGWSRLQGAGLGFRGNVNPSELEGIGPLAPAQTRLWVPLIPEQDATATRRLRIMVAPPGKTADVRIVFRNSLGATLDTRQSTITPGGSVIILPSKDTGTQAPASAEIVAGVPVSARLEVNGMKDAWSVEGLTPASPAPRQLVQPHSELSGLFTSRLSLLNSATSSRSATLRFFSAGGNPVGSAVTRDIPALGTLNETVESLLGNSIPGTKNAGWFQLESNTGEVMAVVLAVDSNSGAKAASALGTVGTGPWVLPFYVENSGYYTGLAISNPSDKPASVNLVAYGPNGEEISGSNASLGSRQSRTSLLSQWIPKLGNESSGYLVITSNGPLSLLSYFGTTDGASLAAIPFTAGK